MSDFALYINSNIQTSLLQVADSGIDCDFEHFRVLKCTLRLLHESIDHCCRHCVQLQDVIQDVSALGLKHRFGARVQQIVLQKFEDAWEDRFLVSQHLIQDQVAEESVALLRVKEVVNQVADQSECIVLEGLVPQEDDEEIGHQSLDLGLLD